MPVKNEAVYLKPCLDSIRNQTESHFELIAVDDHSEDTSFDILNTYAKQDSRIKVFKNEGSGTIDALRTASKYIKGSFVTRMDADDIMPNYKLEELKTTLDMGGQGHISTGFVKYFSDKTLNEGYINYAQWLNQLCDQDSHYEHVFKECVIASPNWMMYSKDFELIGRFDDSIYPEDYHFVFKLFEAKINIVSSQKVTHLWRDHSDRASRNLEMYRDQKFYPLKVSYFLKLYHVDAVSVWGAGPSGKALVKTLLKNNIKVHWVTRTQRKIGETIYGVNVHSVKTLKDKLNEHLMIAVSQKGSMNKIKDYLQQIYFQNYYEF